MIAQGIWFILTIACVVWYSIMTVYVGIKGARDIKEMLQRLSESNGNGEAS